MSSSVGAAAPRRRAGRPSPLLLTLGILAAVAMLATAFAHFFTDQLWFSALGYSGVFWTQLGAEAALFALAFVVVAAAVALNIGLAFRLRPAVRRRGASAILDRYRDGLESHLGWAILLPALLLGGTAGLSMAGQSLPVLAWLHRTPTGYVDPTFKLDASFFLFDYPVLRLITSLLLSALIFSLFAAVAVHFAVGNVVTGRRPAATRVPGPFARHISILAGLAVLVYAAENWLDRYGLAVSDGGLFDGLKYTDVNARLAAKAAVAGIALVVALLFFANAFVNRMILPVTGVALMVISGIILSLIYPAIIQSFTVRPNEPDRERPFIAAHVDATRRAFGIDGVQIESYPAVTNAAPGQLKSDAAALPGIRLMDPAVVGNTFEQLQQVRGYYAFPDTLAVDRYSVDGKTTDTVVAARELNMTAIPDPRNWNNIHTVYTHGYGFVSSYGNRRQANGEPVWITRDIPPVGQIEQAQSRIYYGQASSQFAIVGRPAGQTPIELDTPGGGNGGGETYNTYDGKGGVAMGNPLLRVAYALRFSDLNILLSDRVNAESRILYDRTPSERVRQVAPWLSLDRAVYPAVVSGRLVWILDGYTTSNTFPNSQKVALTDTASDPTTVGAEQVNYLRNSVKAVVDAYDGSVALYAWDEGDAVLRAYQGAFPGTVQPRSAMSPELLSHVRYPQDLFNVQRTLLGRYHMTDPGAWYQQSDLWEVPTEPTVPNATAKEPPYYLSIRWPGETQPAFSLTSAFVPRGRSNLAAYLAVNADAASADYGKLRVLRMPDTHQIDGPGQTYNAIMNDGKVAQLLRNYTSQGSAEAKPGNLLTLPMGGGLLYVQPIFTQRTGNAGSYPVLTYVAVRFGQHVGIGTTLQEALDQVFAGDSGAKTGETGTTGSTGSTPGGTTTQPGGTATPGPVDQAAATAALQSAQEHFTAADAALKAGDLATYQKELEEARKQVEAGLKAMGR